jgi:glycosyltransferase involved in cell wall biosynthesis
MAPRPDGPQVVLVIPAWNEPDAIGAVLDEVPHGAVAECIVVVGSEADPTAPVARQHGARVLVQSQRGYGAACWTGARAALHDGAEIVVFLDGDYADPPAELPRVLQPVLDGTAELSLGRRDMRLHPEALPRHALLGNQVVLWLVRLLVGVRLRDLPSFKAIRASTLDRLDMREMTYGWTVEMVVKAARAHLRIVEVDVPYRPRRGGRSKVAGSLRGSLGAAGTLLMCAVAYAAGPRWSIVRGQ